MCPRWSKGTEERVSWVFFSPSPDVLCNSQIQGVQPVLTPDDCNLAEEIAKTNENLMTLLMNRYGLSQEEISNITCDPWSGT